MSYSEPTLPPGKIARISSHDVLVGMYISELDCNWSETPFPLGGFHIKNADDIQLLQKFCSKVAIDINKGAAPARHRRNNLTILSSARRATPAAANLRVDRAAYPVTRTIKQLLDDTASAYQSVTTVMTELARAVRAGEALDLESVSAPMEALLDSLIANPQALVWLLNTEDKPASDSTYCVRAAAWAAMLARQFGLTRSDMKTLFLGTLLCDVGIYLLPERLTDKRGQFRKKEYLAYRKHVEFSEELLPIYEQVNEKTLRIVRSHHERHDGLGFPKSLKGDQIPALARFAILAYSYERLLCSSQRHKQVSPARALTKLYRQRNLKYPEQLVFEFIHMLGTYPVGSLVQLSTKEIGLVLEQVENERLAPRIAIIGAGNKLLDSNEKLKVVNLSDVKDAEAGRRIISSINPRDLDIDLEKYRFQFIGRKLSVAGFKIRL